MSDYDIQARKQRWRDFLDPASSPQHVFQIGYLPGLPPRPHPWPDLKQERIEWAWRQYELQLERSEWLHDDSLPYLDVFTGTEIFAEAFGCPVHRPDNNMPFALPLIHSAREVSRLSVPRLESSSLMLLFEIADELQRRAGKGVLFKLVDIQSPMDIAALIWDNRVSVDIRSPRCYT